MMQSGQAPKAPRIVPEEIAEEITTVDDVELVRRCLDNDQAAWREFMHRFDSDVRTAARTRLWRVFLAHGMPSDAIDDVLGDLYLGLVYNDAAVLRDWSAEESPLVAWLAMLAYRIGLSHARRAKVRRRYRDVLFEAQKIAEKESQPGASWIGNDEDALMELLTKVGAPKVPRKRVRAKKRV